MKKLTAHASLPLLAVVALSSCEAISKAPKGSPRVEVEVAVKLDESYTEPLQGVGDDFARAVENLIMSKADLGLRFYPVSSKQYSSGDPRPEYLMTIEIRDLEIGLDHRTINPKEADPFIETYVKQFDCAVTTDLSKRRDSGPELTVGRADGNARVLVKSRKDEASGSVTVRRETEDKAELTVAHNELLRGIEKALRPALKKLITPVDRELAYRQTAATGDQPAAPNK